jgi:hypothetical protein
MKIEKVKETYILTEEETESRVQLEVNFRTGTHELLRMKVDPGSLIVERAIELSVDILKQRNNERENDPRT